MKRALKRSAKQLVSCESLLAKTGQVCSESTVNTLGLGGVGSNAHEDAVDGKTPPPAASACQPCPDKDDLSLQELFNKPLGTIFPPLRSCSSHVPGQASSSGAGQASGSGAGQASSGGAGPSSSKGAEQASGGGAPLGSAGATASERSVKPRRLGPAARVATGSGYVLLNHSNKSIDAHCETCGASFDKKWTKFARARVESTRAQGRPLATAVAWLNLPDGCPGDFAAHKGAWNTLSRRTRTSWRESIQDNPEFDDFRAKERSPRSDESRGEPLVPP